MSILNRLNKNINFGVNECIITAKHIGKLISKPLIYLFLKIESCELTTVYETHNWVLKGFSTKN